MTPVERKQRRQLAAYRQKMIEQQSIIRTQRRALLWVHEKHKEQRKAIDEALAKGCTV